MTSRPTSLPLPFDPVSCRQVAQELRSALRGVAASVSIVTGGQGDHAAGITATSVTCVSLDPPMVLVCVNRATRLHAVLARTGMFRLHYLASGQEALAAAFGSSDTPDRFGIGAWDMNATHAPRLRDCMADMVCAVSACVEAGSHSVFLGRVEAVTTSDRAPLVYRDGRYHHLAV